LYTHSDYLYADIMYDTTEIRFLYTEGNL
jgi:hypothetical protein